MQPLFGIQVPYCACSCGPLGRNEAQKVSPSVLSSRYGFGCAIPIRRSVAKIAISLNVQVKHRELISFGCMLTPHGSVLITARSAKIFSVQCSCWIFGENILCFCSVLDFNQNSLLGYQSGSFAYQNMPLFLH
jgi:hypothetical protein